LGYDHAFMGESGKVLSIHSLVEARLYLRVRPCDGCGTGPLVTDAGGVRHDAEGHVLIVPVICGFCGMSDEIRFDTGGLDFSDSFVAGWSEEVIDASINPTDDASKVIDVAGWLTLYSLLEADARAAGDRKEARQYHLCAAGCIDEALKFFDADNDLPPADAFFGDNSRSQFRDRPESFTRQHLIDLRNRLPVRVGMGSEADLEDVSEKNNKRWWWPWG
jgi:hypothetical protein